MPVTRFTVCVLFWPGSLPTPNRQSVYKGVFLGVLKTFAPVALLCWSSVDRQVCFPQRGSLRRAEGVFLGGKHGGGGGQANRAPAWLEIEFSLPAAFFFFFKSDNKFQQKCTAGRGQGNSASWYQRPLCVSGNYQQIDGIFV